MFLRVPIQNQKILSRGIRLIRIFDRVVRGHVIGWTVKSPIRMLGCVSPKFRSGLCKAFNSKPHNEADTAMFKSKRRLSSAENAYIVLHILSMRLKKCSSNTYTFSVPFKYEHSGYAAILHAEVF